jgi:hypothetical protein
MPFAHMTRVEDVAFKKNFSDILQKPYIPAGQRLKEISTNAYNPLPTEPCHAQICLSTTGFLDKLGTAKLNLPRTTIRSTPSFHLNEDMYSDVCVCPRVCVKIRRTESGRVARGKKEVLTCENRAGWPG